MDMKVGFIGLGLIGGSIAKAIRQYYPDTTIVAFDKNRETLALATQEALANTVTTTIDENFEGCDYIFLCAPVVHNASYLCQLKNYVAENTILTDVGSVKNNIHKEVEKQQLEYCFIGGHPMAGSEKSGYPNSKAMLIENAYYILTPGKDVPEEKVKAYESLVSSLKAIPIILDYKEHDYVTGAISHLPHVIASTLVNYVREHDTKQELMKHLAAGGFKDITRIASSSPTMWQHILLSNRENVSAILGEYIEMLQEAKEFIDESNGRNIYHMFDTSRNYRDSLPSSSMGPIKKTYAIYCDIIDEQGAIATIATILASNAINIKNISIVHNRSFEEGVLRIEFYNEASSSKAAELLQKFRYIVYER
ncbi:MAG: prephenate dehydrogenase [Dorea sp.]|nr:prephenate dehydrogenase [Dorea sp.]